MEERYARLVALLGDKNREWREGSAPESFATAIAGYHLEVSQEPGPEDTLDIRIRILDEDGNEIDSFTDPEILPVMRGAYVKMLQIYKAARGSARGATKALDAILGELEPEIPF